MLKRIFSRLDKQSHEREHLPFPAIARVPIQFLLTTLLITVVLKINIPRINLFMKKRQFILAIALAAVAVTSAFAAKNPMVGGKEMYPTKDIIDNAVNSADHTTLVAAVKAAGLVDTLKGPGPFTVFAPTNEAFSKLPPGALDNLLKPENKDTLTKVLTYHVVAGKLSSSDIKKKIKAGKGTAELQTVSGGERRAMMKGNRLVLKDEKGGLSAVTMPNVFQSNGVIHVVDTVLMPN